ncbi:MAG: hypothetical protein Fur0041_19020 [Bacteroidia bacterium]
MPSGIDLGIRQDLFKGIATATFNVTDIFDWRKMKIENQNTGYYFTFWRKRESRVAMVSFSWRFGSGEDLNQQRKKNNQQPSGDDMQMGF